jgi:hypothetical protein
MLVQFPGLVIKVALVLRRAAPGNGLLRLSPEMVVSRSRGQSSTVTVIPGDD